jgi:serine/threonine protein kinase
MPKDLITDLKPEEWQAAEAFFADNPEIQKLDRTHDLGATRIDRKTQRPRAPTPGLEPGVVLNHSFILVKAPDGSNKIYALANKNKKQGYMGEGGFGKVKFCQSKDGTNFAYKIEAEASVLERKIMLDLKRSQGVQTRKSLEEKEIRFKSGKKEKTKSTAITVSTYFAGGEVKDLKGIEAGVTGNLQLYITAIQSCQEIQALHNLNYVHADIKASNLMFAEPVKGFDIRVKTIDFGLAKEVVPGEDSVQAPDISGTPGYMAPEISQGTYGFASDVYALGKMFDKILPDQLKDNEQLKSLVTAMMDDDPSDRPSLAAVHYRLNAIMQQQPSFDQVPDAMKQSLTAFPQPDNLTPEQIALNATKLEWAKVRFSIADKKRNFVEQVGILHEQLKKAETTLSKLENSPARNFPWVIKTIEKLENTISEIKAKLLAEESSYKKDFRSFQDQKMELGNKIAQLEQTIQEQQAALKKPSVPEDSESEEENEEEEEQELSEDEDEDEEVEQELSSESEEEENVEEEEQELSAKSEEEEEEELSEDEDEEVEQELPEDEDEEEELVMAQVVDEEVNDELSSESEEENEEEELLMGEVHQADPLPDDLDQLKEMFKTARHETMKAVEAVYPLRDQKPQEYKAALAADQLARERKEEIRAKIVELQKKNVAPLKPVEKQHGPLMMSAGGKIAATHHIAEKPQIKIADNPDPVKPQRKRL